MSLNVTCHQVIDRFFCTSIWQIGCRGNYPKVCKCNLWTHLESSIFCNLWSSNKVSWLESKGSLWQLFGHPFPCIDSSSKVKMSRISLQSISSKAEILKNFRFANQIFQIKLLNFSFFGGQVVWCSQYLQRALVVQCCLSSNFNQCHSLTKTLLQIYHI